MAVRGSGDNSLIKQGILSGVATLLFSVVIVMWQAIDKLSDEIGTKAGAYELDQVIEVIWTLREQGEFEKRIEAKHSSLDDKIARIYIEIDRLRDGK